MFFKEKSLLLKFSFRIFWCWVDVKIASFWLQLLIKQLFRSLFLLRSILTVQYIDRIEDDDRSVQHATSRFSSLSYRLNSEDIPNQSIAEKTICICWFDRVCWGKLNQLKFNWKKDLHTNWHFSEKDIHFLYSSKYLVKPFYVFRSMENLGTLYNMIVSLS